MLLGNERTVEWPDSGKVGSVTVRRPFRRRGLATALLLHAFAAFRRHGIRRVITDTDSESFTAGPVLYERVGMREFRRELVLERELRPGEELRATHEREWRPPSRGVTKHRFSPIIGVWRPAALG